MIKVSSTLSTNDGSNSSVLTEFRDMAVLLDPSVEADEFLFFDIETTGLDSHNDSIYLIGAMYLDNNAVIVNQFFSEYYEDEENVLKAFIGLSRTHKALVHFNGGRFDIPFIAARYSNYFDEAPFEGNKSFDLYLLLKNYRDALGLSSMKQTSLERYCGFIRKDTFTGGELIDYYLKYLALKKTEEKIRNIVMNQEQASVIPPYSPIPDSGLPVLGELKLQSVFDSLLLHNYEDVCGMLECGRALELIGLLNGDYDLNISSDQDYIYLDIDYHQNSFSSFLPKKLNSGAEGITIMLQVYELELKLYYDNYKEYYYIPSQDIAVHKSLADFYDKSIRQKATKSTCFNKCHGSFVKGPLSVSEAAIRADGYKTFKPDYYDKEYYLDAAVFTGGNNNIKEVIKYYILNLLKASC